MRTFIFLIFSAVAIAIAGCSSEPEGTTISGKISDAGDMKIFLDKTTVSNKAMVIEQTDADGDGQFKFSFPEGLEKGIYRIRIGAKKAYLVLSGDEGQVTINGDLAGLDRYTFEIEGSPSSEEFTNAMDGIYTKKMGVEEITKFMSDSKDPLAAMQVGIMALGRPEFAENHSELKKRMEAEYPDLDYTQEYVSFVNQLQAAYAQQQARERIKVGMPAPDITMNNPDGKMYSLSDLKGKVVLLDFWASWCGPCRRANPHVVEIYKKYKDQGFTVFSVSLDGLDNRTKERFSSDKEIELNMNSSKQRWVQAIEKDNLEWEYHVSELAKWDTQAARMYGVTGIPKTFLIDRDGNIAAVNPRYNLEEELTKLL